MEIKAVKPLQASSQRMTFSYPSTGTTVSFINSPELTRVLTACAVGPLPGGMHGKRRGKRKRRRGNLLGYHELHADDQV
jgi:hypothetical protein